MNKLIQAVGVVIKQRGYTGLSIANISAEAGVDRKLISLYFESVNNLIETYIRSKDYWVSAAVKALQMFAKTENAGSRELLERLLLCQMDDLINDEEMQKILLWQISEKSNIMAHVAHSQKHIYALLFPFSDKELLGKDVDLRAISAILTAGIYGLVLHAKATESTFYGIDLNTEAGMSRIKNAVTTTLEQTYDGAKEL